MTGGTGASSGSLQTLVGTGIVIAGLYFGRDVLIPFALALLLTFLLAPAVLLLRRFRIGRIPAVLVTVVLAFTLIGLLGWMVTGQILHLANELPSYQRNISQKLGSLNTPGGGLIERTSRMLSELNREMAVPGGDPAVRPVPVEVQPPPASALDTLSAFVGPLLAPLATAGVVIVLVIFMLIQREDLRDRFIGLVGMDRMNLTTQALDDAGSRISRYLLMQVLINVTYGFPIGIGLYFIGVPNALLWGVLATVLRFVPYIGPLMAMALPLLLAFAVDPGWNMLLMTGGLFLVIELISNNVIEPWLYGSSTGISSVAIMVAAIFWTLLWGPLGLLLSTPLTVCLAVAGRYVPQLSFLSMLLGNEPALQPEVRLYQRMLAMDAEEASEIAGELLEKRPLIDVYERLVIPALSLAETDRHQGLLDEERKRFIMSNTRDLVAELAAIDAARRGAAAAAVPGLPQTSIVVLPAHDESDEVAGLMVQELLRDRAAVDVAVLSADEPLDRRIEAIARRRPAVVLVSSVPPAAVRNAAHVCKRLRAELPDTLVHVGVWSHQADPGQLRARLPESLAPTLMTQLAPAIDALAALAQPTGPDTMEAAPIPANEASRLEALRRTRLLDTPPHEAFDRVTRKLAEIFDAPISLMSLVDETRQFWLSQSGLPDELAAARAAARDTSICGHVVAGDTTIVVEDTWQDPRFSANPFIREQNIRFYAGAPLRASDGSAVGSLCVIDHRPRTMTERERALLQLMADAVMGEVEALAMAHDYADGNASVRALETDLTRARAVQALFEPPQHQTIDRSIVDHRVEAGSGLAATLLFTHKRLDGTVAIVIGDAGAGGISGPLMAVAISATAERLSERCPSPGDLLSEVNALLPCPGRGLPATVTAAIFSPADGRLEIACAGHCPPLLVARSGTTIIEVALEPPLFDDACRRYSTGTPLILDPDDRVLFYTDGVVNLAGTEDGLLGVDGLAQLAAEHDQPSGDAFLSGLGGALSRLSQTHSGGWCLLSLDYRPSRVDTGDPDDLDFLAAAS